MPRVLHGLVLPPPEAARPAAPSADKDDEDGPNAATLRACLPPRPAVALRQALCAVAGPSDVTIAGNGEGLQVQVLGCDRRALAVLALGESVFSDFKCEMPVALCMDKDPLSGALGASCSSDSLELQWSGGFDALNLRSGIVDTDLELKPGEPFVIPEQPYTVLVKMPADEFRKICADLEVFGEVMQVEASKGGVNFSVLEKLFRLTDSGPGSPVGRVALTVHGPVTASFDIRCLADLARSAPNSGRVELRFGPDTPLFVSCDVGLEKAGRLQFYLAPWT